MIKYILIILTVFSAIFAELVGLTREGISWSKFPKNLTKGGLFFFFLTIILGLGSIYSLSREERNNKNDREVLSRTIEQQKIKIDSLKNGITNLNNDIKKYQHPIPTSFSFRVDVLISVNEDNQKKLLDKFDFIDDFYVAFKVHDFVSPKIFGIDNNPSTFDILEKDKDYFLGKQKNKIQCRIMDMKLDVRESNLNYNSIFDICNKDIEFQVFITPKKKWRSVDYEIEFYNMVISTPNKLELIIPKSGTEKQIMTFKLKNQCWE